MLRSTIPRALSINGSGGYHSRPGGLYSDNWQGTLGDIDPRTRHRESGICNCTRSRGCHVNGRETHGDSMIVDPWGVVLDRLPHGAGIVIANINPEYQSNLRKSLPALNHRTLHHC